MLGFLEDVICDMEAGVFDYTDNGQCSNCGQCCSRFLPVSEKEVKEIKRYVKKHHIEACIHFAPTREPLIDLTCPFRDNTKRICTIYDVRPAICRDFKCDKPKKKIMANKEMYHERYNVVDFWEEIYG